METGCQCWPFLICIASFSSVLCLPVRAQISEEVGCPSDRKQNPGIIGASLGRTNLLFHFLFLPAYFVLPPLPMSWRKDVSSSDAQAVRNPSCAQLFLRNRVSENSLGLGSFQVAVWSLIARNCLSAFSSLYFFSYFSSIGSFFFFPSFYICQALGSEVSNSCEFVLPVSVVVFLLTTRKRRCSAAQTIFVPGLPRCQASRIYFAVSLRVAVARTY